MPPLFIPTLTASTHSKPRSALLISRCTHPALSLPPPPLMRGDRTPTCAPSIATQVAASHLTLHPSFHALPPISTQARRSSPPHTPTPSSSSLSLVVPVSAEFDDFDLLDDGEAPSATPVCSSRSPAPWGTSRGQPGSDAISALNSTSAPNVTHAAASPMLAPSTTSAPSDAGARTRFGLSVFAQLPTPHGRALLPDVGPQQSPQGAALGGLRRRGCRRLARE